jgi:hypothetical protein
VKNPQKENVDVSISVVEFLRSVPTEREARALFDRVAQLRRLIAELECDCTEWQCDADLRLTVTKMKSQADYAKLTLSLLQPMKKH